MVHGSKGSSHSDNKRRDVLLTEETQLNKNSCLVCKGDHKLYGCKQFTTQTVERRWEIAKKYKLCFACLGYGHTTQLCKFKKVCNIDNCDRKHHKLLHNVRANVTQEPQQQSSVLSCSDPAVKKQQNLMFRIIPVTLYAKNKQLNTYALLDEGSSVSLIDKSILEMLNIKGPKRNLNVNWFGGKSTNQWSSVVDIQVSGVDIDSKFIMQNVYGVADIQLPTQSLAADNIQQKLNIPLASYENAKPLLLIGLDNCHLSTAMKTIEVANGGPYVANTKLGWVLYGPNTTKSKIVATCLAIHDTMDEMHDLITNYFEDENFGVKAVDPLDSDEDARSKAILKSTIKKVGEKYQSGLLWKSDGIVLPDSYEMAKKRLITLERKMQKDIGFAEEYGKIIKDYQEKGYARKLTPNEPALIGPKTWYLPHFAVINPNKLRKVRMVFDAAAKVDGVSLNSNLLKGPQEYRPMQAVLFNFRVGKIAVCADIKEMFHQVIIQPQNREAQRFLWRDGDTTRPPDKYEMNVMIFGAACSPCIAQHVKTTNALQYQTQKPRAVKAIIENHYVDDFVDSFDSADEAIQIAKEVRDIYKEAGFELRKFASNYKELLTALDAGMNSQTQFDKTESGLSVEKVLGMYWQPEIDVFKYRLKLSRIAPEIVNETRVPTKRELLSIVMSVFDPLGFLSHLMITAKLLMREVWRSSVSWDDPIPESLKHLWVVWLSDAKKVEQLEIPRHYFGSIAVNKVELHIFVDASADAFVAVAYWRIIDDKIKVSFVSGKTK